MPVWMVCLLFGGNDLQPVAIGVIDKVDAHGGVFKADAAHFLMQGVGGFKVLGLEGQMEFQFAQVILLGMTLQPGQFQLEGVVSLPKNLMT